MSLPAKQQEELTQWNRQKAEQRLKDCGNQFKEVSNAGRFRITKRSALLIVFSALCIYVAMGIVPFSVNLYNHYKLSKIRVGMPKQEAIDILGVGPYRSPDGSEFIDMREQRNMMVELLDLSLSRSIEGHRVTIKNGVVESIDSLIGTEFF